MKMPKLAQWINGAGMAILLGFGLVALLLTAGTMLQLRIIATLPLGLAIIGLIYWWGRDRQFESSARGGDGAARWLWIVLGAGVVARVVFWLLIHNDLVLQSDFLVYFRSAEHLVQFHEYRVPEREGLLLAYRPPGTAFLLGLVMFVTGPTAWSPLLLNTFCFAATGWLLWSIARPKLPASAALGVVAMLAFWPSDIMFAAVPQSESATLLGVSLLMYLTTRRHENLMRWAVSISLLTGLLCLMRNSNLALTGLWALIAIQQPLSWPKRLRLCVVLVVLTFVPILPWTYRNYQVLGTPVLVATNGGDNLYSSNNPDTDGSWHDSVARIRVYLPDELKMDREGKRMAMEWITSHPAGFLKLSLNKLRILMNDDSQGPHSVLQAGTGYSGVWLTVSEAASSLWWLLLWGLALTAIRYRRVWIEDPDVPVFVALAAFPSLLYLVFQSQARYHMPMVPPLLILAGYALALRRTKPGASTRG